MAIATEMGEPSPSGSRLKKAKVEAMETTGESTATCTSRGDETRGETDVLKTAARALSNLKVLYVRSLKRAISGGA